MKLGQILMVFVAILLFSCNRIQEPSFKKLDKTKIISVNKDTVTILSNAIYHNPNPVGGSLSETNIDIVVEGIKMTDIVQNQNITFGGNEDFKLPIYIKVPISELYGKKKGFLSKALSVLGKRTLEVSYQGDAKFKIAGVNLDIPIARKDTIEIKL